MREKPDTFNRARIEILNYILNFSTAKYFGEKKIGFDNSLHNVQSAWRGGFSDAKAPIGSLCMLSSAPFTKYYLSWLIEYKEEGYGGSWLMKSIEDHSLCWWTNVSVYFFPPETTQRFPLWKWSDRQFDFYERWKRAQKRVGDYWTKGKLPVFNEDGSVVLGTREHIFMTVGQGDGYCPEKKFPDWKKVKFSEMVEFARFAVSSNPNKIKTTHS